MDDLDHDVDLAIIGSGAAALAAFIAAHLLLDTVVAVGATYKARGVLKRLAVTPVSATLLVVTQMPTYTLPGVGTAVGMLAVGRLAGAHVELIPHLIWVVPLVALVIFTKLGLAFVISGLLPHPGAAGQLSSGRGRAPAVPQRRHAPRRRPPRCAAGDHQGRGAVHLDHRSHPRRRPRRRQHH
jgi:hypothetical protein